jgi:DNA polymerase-3 subunit epsilon
MRAIAIDFETANGARASACALGIAVIEGGRIVAADYRLIRPRPLEFGYYETRVHGLTAEDVADAPEFPDVFAAVRRYLGSHLLMAHNQSFDVGVIRASAALYGLDLPPFDVLCTLELARAIWRGPVGHKLSDIAPRLGVDFRHHHAGDDAVMAARIGLHAAELAGTTAVSAAARRFGVALRRIEPGEPVAAAREDAPVRRRNGARQTETTTGGATDRLAFEVAGSTGRPYRVEAGARGDAFFVRCGCPAGRNRLICHHVRDLAAGSVDHLLSANVADVTEFARRCARAGGLAAMFGRADGR